jgi:hypothetical protein
MLWLFVTGSPKETRKTVKAWMTIGQRHSLP